MEAQNNLPTENPAECFLLFENADYIPISKPTETNVFYPLFRPEIWEIV